MEYNRLPIQLGDIKTDMLVNDYNQTYSGRGFDSRHLHHLGGSIMFSWFKKKKPNKDLPNFDFEDTIEETLWEIKQEYDLETEEVEMTVFQKRNYINYMNDCLKSKK